jgi:Ca2+-binding EF-hand superfamily protein
MMEKLGQTKTRLELNDIIAEVDAGNKGYISLADFFRVRKRGKCKEKERDKVTNNT